LKTALEAHGRWLDWAGLDWAGAVLGQSEWEALWARYHRQAGDHGQAHAHAERALADATAPRQPLALLAVHRLLGMLATDAGKYDEATAQLGTALTLAETCAAPYEKALTLLALAECTGAAGDAARASILLDEVRAICIPLAARPVLAATDALAVRLGAPLAGATVDRIGLSAREVEVLRLIAAGQTNRQIATALFLSRHTVGIHVAHILQKTNTDNRAAAASFALRQGLI
jgi:DNA-binding CsgD family transcriptional regulator